MEDTQFYNQPVNFHGTYEVEMLAYQPLENSKLKVDIINTFVSLIIISSITMALSLGDIDYIHDNIGYIMGIMGLIYLMSFIYIFLAFKKKKYAIREKDISYKNGLVWQRTTVLPFNRVQHCEVKQGPIERFFKIAELKIYTAGGSSSDMSISGLNIEKAYHIKDFIVKKTVDEEE